MLVFHAFLTCELVGIGSREAEGPCDSSYSPTVLGSELLSPRCARLLCQALGTPTENA